MRRLLFFTLVILLTAVPALAQDAATTDTTHIRIAHLSPDAPLVDIYVNGELSEVTGLGFMDVSGWLALPADTYEIAVVPAGAAPTDAAFGPVSLPLTADAWITAAAVGSLDNATFALALVLEDYVTPLESGSARVTVFHSIEDAPGVDVRLVDGTLLVPDVAYTNFATFDVPAGAYDLQVVPAGEDEPVVLDLSGTALDADTYYFIAAVGALATPDFAFAATTAAELDMQMLPADAASTAEAAATEIPAVTPEA